MLAVYNLSNPFLLVPMLSFQKIVFRRVSVGISFRVGYKGRVAAADRSLKNMYVLYLKQASPKQCEIAAAESQRVVTFREKSRKRTVSSGWEC